jgi:hypothetical protein
VQQLVFVVDDNVAISGAIDDTVHIEGLRNAGDHSRP